MTEKLRQLRKALNMNQAEFAKHLGLAQPSYSLIEKGKRPLAEIYIKTIIAQFNVNEEWLRGNSETMFKKNNRSKELEEIFNQLTPATQDYIFTITYQLREEEKKRK